MHQAHKAKLSEQSFPDRASRLLGTCQSLVFSLLDVYITVSIAHQPQSTVTKDEPNAMHYQTQFGDITIAKGNSRKFVTALDGGH